ncbi:MAG: energy transducer TonB [Saprospirales bacterium]|nr:MAG: energy transducer TonB [Saprospirales bacterium]
MSYEEENEREDKRKGLYFSIGYSLLLIAVLFLPLLSYQYPPPGQEGILVSFGMPEVGQGDDLPDTQQEEEVEPTPPVEVEEVVEPIQEEVVPPEPDDNIITSEMEEEIRIREQREQERQREDAERRRIEELERERREAEAEQRRRAEEEARRQQEQYEQAKQQFGEFLGTGSGRTGQSGSQGVSDGDPDASRLEGISSGSGMVGGGLGDRGVLFEPSIQDNSQKTGRVVVRVCVNAEGEVVSAEYTQRGSTTTDGELRQKAIDSARRFKFTKSNIDRQCGTITIDFRLE